MIKPIFLTIAMTGALVVGAIAHTPEPFHPRAAAAAASPQPTLRTYNGPAQQIPVKAQYLDTMEVSETASGEGWGFSSPLSPRAMPWIAPRSISFCPMGRPPPPIKSPLSPAPTA